VREDEKGIPGGVKVRGREGNRGIAQETTSCYR
jgi:hypothetical protein